MLRPRREVASLLNGDVASASRGRILGALALADHRWDDANVLLSDAWQLRDPADHATGVGIADLLDYLHHQLGNHEQAVDWCQESLALLAPPQRPTSSFDTIFQLAMIYTAAGRAWEARSMFEARPELIEHTSVSHRLAIAMIDLWTHTSPESILELQTLATDLRTSGPMPLWITAETALATAFMSHGRTNDALASLIRVTSSGDSGYLELECSARAAMALVLAWQNDFDASDAELQLAISLVDEVGQVPHARHAIALAMGYRALLSGQYEDVVEHTRQMRPHPDSVEFYSSHPIERLTCEAFLNLGRLSDAEAELELLEAVEDRLATGTRAGTYGLRGALMMLSGDCAEASAAFQRALDVSGDSDDFNRAHLLFLRGWSRCSAGHDVEAGQHDLHEARDLFAALDARGWARRCEQALPVTQDSTTEHHHALANLTPTERVVAGLIGAGKSNREAASELVVSVRTIESHLSRIYTKLYLRNRTELAMVVSGARESVHE